VFYYSLVPAISFRDSHYRPHRLICLVMSCLFCLSDMSGFVSGFVDSFGITNIVVEMQCTRRGSRPTGCCWRRAMLAWCSVAWTQPSLKRNMVGRLAGWQVVWKWKCVRNEGFFYVIGCAAKRSLQATAAVRGPPLRCGGVREGERACATTTKPEGAVEPSLLVGVA
jgi:hypothetical protein